MLKQCLEVFSREYEKYGDRLILDRYSLANGVYILVDKNTGDILNEAIITKDNNSDKDILDTFGQLDYLSGLLEMNKPATRTKEVHSNNYLSFFVKAENLIPDKNKKVKTGIETVNTYYSDLEDIKTKMSKDKNTRELYESILPEVGDIDSVDLNKCKDWVKDNIGKFYEKYKLAKNIGYVKIFFKDDIEKYKNESRRYVYPKIYNKNKYNVKIDDVLYGVHNNNFGLNEKKPFLMKVGRKNEYPMLVKLDEALLMKKFFDYLLCLVNSNPRINNLYIDDRLHPLSDNEIMEEEFQGLYLRIAKEKNEAEIVDCDTIDHYSPKVKLKVEKIIDFDITTEDRKNTLHYGTINNIKDIKNTISGVFYNGFLASNIFSETEEIKKIKIGQELKSEIIRSRVAYGNWFYKGDTRLIKNIFEDDSMKWIIKNIIGGYKLKAIEQFNLRAAVLKYLKGDNQNMKRKFSELYNKIFDGLLNGNLELSTSEEYYFFVGQVAYALLSRSKANKKDMSLIRIIESHKLSILKKRFDSIYRKYRHNEFMSDKIMRLAISSISDYELDDDKVNMEALNCGYLYKNAVIEAKQERAKQNKAKEDEKDKENIDEVI